MTRPQVASRSEVARGLRASVCAATPRRGSLLYKTVKAFHNSAAAFRAAACACAFACGIAFADAPATATWTGGGDRSVLTDPANWQCRDSSGNVMEGAIPDASATTVSVTGATTFNFPAGKTAIWKSLTVSGTVTLAADCDWRGAGSMFSYVAANSTLNLKGHNLYVAVPNGSANRKITVTDDSVAGSGGEFHFEVAEGTTFSNGAAWNNDSQIWFDGTVKAVKDGKGSYLIGACHGAKNFKFYKHSGGTTVHEGLMLILNDGEGTANETYYAQSTRPVFGAYGSAITIEAGGTLDYKGIYDLHLYKMYMNGGHVHEHAHAEVSRMGFQRCNRLRRRFLHQRGAHCAHRRPVHPEWPHALRHDSGEPDMALP